jgi:hypothetical protein
MGGTGAGEILTPMVGEMVSVIEFDWVLFPLIDGSA